MTHWHESLVAGLTAPLPDADIPLIPTDLERYSVDEFNEFWYDSNMSDAGVTPPRPARGNTWGTPTEFPSCERPFSWSL